MPENGLPRMWLGYRCSCKVRVMAWREIARGVCSVVNLFCKTISRLWLREGLPHSFAVEDRVRYQSKLHKAGIRRGVARVLENAEVLIMALASETSLNLDILFVVLAVPNERNTGYRPTRLARG